MTTNHTFNGQSVDVVMNTNSRCFNGHYATLLYRGQSGSFVVKGSSKLDCIDSLRRCFPATLNDFNPSVEYFVPLVSAE